MRLWHSDLHISPRDQERMTPAELLCASTDPDDLETMGDTRPPGMSIEQYAEWWRGLTVDERLEIARERWG